MALPPSLKDSASGTPGSLLSPQSNETSQLLKVREWRTQFALLALRVLLALVLGYFISLLKLDYIESFLYDLRIRTQPISHPSSDIVMVMITPQTVEALKVLPGAKEQTRLLTELRKGNPFAVVYALDARQVEGTKQEKLLWANQSDSFEHLYFLTDSLELKGEQDKLTYPPPLQNFKLFSGPKGADKTNFAKDGVTRRLMVSYQEQPTLHYYLASILNPEIKDEKNIRGIFDFLGSKQTYIDFHPKNSYLRIPFEKVLSREYDLELFKDKIVIVGLDLGISVEEYILSPYSRESTSMTAVEMHANMFDTLIKNSAPVRSPWWTDLFFICVTSILTVHVVLAMKPIKGLFVLLSTFFIYTLFAFLLHWIFGIWIALAQPLLAIFLAYYFFIPYRLIIENRRSWEYYQKNKLLEQVEELKTNFISMMSHDLKTPIARIQGMLDVVVKEGSTLTSLQREAIDTIKSSSEDLLKFINAILNYAKIESEGVKLHLQAKDMNILLEDVIKKHEFLAKIKKIQIVKELEPLFPIMMDPDLMKQVFSNLIENAIKYSPEETKILISSEESENFISIQIADQGQGIPVDDLPNIFMKFFRSKNAKSSPIKGSGLGLYLAKYFVELHRGRIMVESTVGQGTTFTVEIPIVQNVPADPVADSTSGKAQQKS